MKLTSADVQKLRVALMAARLANVSNVVITNGYISGVHEGHVAVIFSPVQLDADPEVSLGIIKIQEFEKRLGLFGDDVLVEFELNDAKKVKKLNIRGKAGKVDFRCTDERLISYPKANPDEPGIVLTLTKAEISLISKGSKTLGASVITLQVKRDGTVRFECLDSNRDKFETDIEAQAQFIDEEYSYVNSFDVTNNGALLPLLEHMVKEADSANLILTKTGNISLKAFGHDVFAVPKAQHGDDE